MLRAISSGLVIYLAGILAALADGDAALGKKVFYRCMACHEAASDRDKVGPHLLGIVGRTAGTAQNFNYSQAMKDAGAAGLVWDEANLKAYLGAPKLKVPGNRMGFSGLSSDEDIANVIAYLKAADPKP
ncbi:MULTISPECIES: cytochrome c family protein [unclassified Mesorhizobium]|uniref:c-type cytochrome n=1 Tax=unclassified Mesorhizobium TaxID=325217 RepID=UPI0003CE466C|nr:MULTISPECIES: cytochrome c family protein [unclassified Mesorhizobium]ESX16610.1 cytochrome C transmembrane protein [Mesorhizobium sp. LSJC255A00]ESX32150.1 cytochrome C transmembrane protein [Mesorhizobium sp. LSHC440B00]ESX39133.1 cytochrome C transmembrane protein [Mesorhizobium sp. LSHC432A00]ESX44079.1 cytochrome C transmembrane protein [Mesorhizobium sp. LSHC440A00]ESX79171.1 cytochrome C transmembrane protein [Mesorhizobium sp. LSHC414A00]